MHVSVKSLPAVIADDDDEYQKNKRKGKENFSFRTPYQSFQKHKWSDKYKNSRNEDRTSGKKRPKSRPEILQIYSPAHAGPKSVLVIPDILEHMPDVVPVVSQVEKK